VREEAKQSKEELKKKEAEVALLEGQLKESQNKLIGV